MWGWKKEGQKVSGAVVKGGPREVGKMVEWRVAERAAERGGCRGRRGTKLPLLPLI
jgi:hypothetical protein